MLGLILLFTVACAPTEALPPPGLPAVTLVESTATPSPTIVWFPPTRTPTVFRTQRPSATPQMLPGLGEELYTDNFSDGTAWSNLKAKSDGGNAVLLDRNRIVLAVNVTPVYITSLHKELLLGNFYAETQVQLNRCQGNDTYGMVFRAASDFFAYRYVLNCKGEVRVERMRNTEVVPLQEWTPSGDAPLGSPGSVKLGFWVSGTEMRFFLNDHYQFSVFDGYFKNGGLGFFADSSSPIGLNISFSELAVYGVDYVSPTPTITPTFTRTPTRTPRPR